MKESSKYEARIGPDMFTKAGEDPHDLIVTVTVQSKVTGESVSMSFPKARFFDGKITTHQEVEVIDDQPYSFKVWTIPVNQRVEMELSLVALPDEEEQCIYRLTRQQ